jgi:5-methylcytosine-specific restriction endonuclease McrA
MREYALTKQDYKCAVDGSKICMKTSQGAHIIAHSKGGKTTLNNLAMVATHHNKAMGSMSVTEYKQILGLS